MTGKAASCVSWTGFPGPGPAPAEPPRRKRSPSTTPPARGREGVGTPTTILRNAPIGGLNKRDGADPIHDADLLVAHFNLLHQCANDFPTQTPVCLLQTLVQPLGKGR